MNPCFLHLTALSWVSAVRNTYQFVVWHAVKALKLSVVWNENVLWVLVMLWHGQGRRCCALVSTYSLQINLAYQPTDIFPYLQNHATEFYRFLSMKRGLQ